MKRIGLILLLLGAGLAVLLLSWRPAFDPAPFTAPVAADDALLHRGEYVFHVAGCGACHTAEADGSTPLAGGRRFETAFGVFVSPNITPDAATGIGAWSLVEFARAMRTGVAPGGRHYYPAFPYTSYAAMSDADLRALFVWLKSRAPVERRAPPHELAWYLRLPGAMAAWKLLYFDPPPAPSETPAGGDGLGSYLAEALAHCGECHTPRNAFGAAERSRRHAGSENGPEGKPVPNITPAQTGIGGWSRRALRFFLQTGMQPGGDFAGGRMATVIDESTSRLAGADLDALVEYLRSVPAVETEEEGDGG